MLPLLARNHPIQILEMLASPLSQSLSNLLHSEYFDLCIAAHKIVDQSYPTNVSSTSCETQNQSFPSFEATL